MTRFHAAGQIMGVEMGVPHVRSAGSGRALYMHVVPWGVPARIRTAGGVEFDEWFGRGSVYMDGPVGLWLQHCREGGRQVGRVVSLINQPSWLDAAALVDEDEFGDAVLDLVSRHGERVPVSLGFAKIPYGSTEHARLLGDVPGVERTRVRLTEVAIVPQGAYEGAYVYARGSLSSLPAMQAVAA